MLNSYFNLTDAHNEQNLMENLIIESIQIFGTDIQYIPKTLVDYDQLLGEDPQRAFLSSYTIEGYFENVEGFLGEKNFLNKMGLNIEKQAVFNVAKRRFDEVVLGFSWQGDWVALTSYSINNAVHYNGIIYVSVINTNKDHIPGTDIHKWKVMDQTRPNEGDLIYFPKTHDLFEISFADHEEVFYQLGKIFVWKITCEKFKFSHEVIDTEIVDIDSIAEELENNGTVENDPLADNTNIDESLEDFLNLDIKSPF